HDERAAAYGPDPQAAVRSIGVRRRQRVWWWPQRSPASRRGARVRARGRLPGFPEAPQENGVVMSKRVYDAVRSLVERRGGSMVYQRKGYRHGAWVITIGGSTVVIEAAGNRSFPELDRLYVPRV